ncbi:uncharacterized protein LOC130787422 [Actinidia eriantha]|uniref:uncharacterized protein LOC130787422 n=1 Tax=Actinidia eriantha TaxID=165200 RepID=UPI002590707E|nr:uncharacterized protein LOC130787422 [Actinidia eriantha]
MRSGEKPVQEMVMVGWKVPKKKTKMREFKRVLKIPHGVILGKINAKFNKEESILRISMPKSANGMVGISVEDAKDDQGVEKLVGESPEKGEEGGLMEASQEKTTGEEIENLSERITEKENDERIESTRLKEVKDQEQEQREEIEKKNIVVERKEEVCDLKEATKKRENQEVESGKIKEKGLEKDEQKGVTIEPTKNVPHEVIQEKEIMEDKYDQELDQIKTFSRPKQKIKGHWCFTKVDLVLPDG